MPKVLIATSNPAKLAEIKHFLKGLPIEILSLADVNVKGEPVEDGNTFTENAIIKAKYYFAQTHIPTIADDGGIEIDYFHGDPGVKSKRWIGGIETSDKELIEYTLTKMESLHRAKRGAQLHTVLALILPNGKTKLAEGIVRGIIAEKVSDIVTKGFPYRAIFYLPEIKKYYDPQKMTKKEYEKFGHRGKAVRKLAKIIKKELL